MITATIIVVLHVLYDRTNIGGCVSCNHPACWPKRKRCKHYCPLLTDQQHSVMHELPNANTASLTLKFGQPCKSIC